MMRRIACAVAFTSAVFSLVARDAWAGNRQLEGGASIGVHGATGTHAGIGGLVALHGGLRPNDWLRVYGRLEYGLGAGLDLATTPRHHAALSVGVAYVFDVLTFAPWLGIGAVGGYEASASWAGPVVGAEVRLGGDVYLSRYFALTFQIAGAVYLNELTRNWGSFTGTGGLRWTLDL